MLPVLLLVRVRMRVSMGHVLLSCAQGVRHVDVRGNGGWGCGGGLIPDAEEVDGRGAVSQVVSKRKRVLKG